MPLGILGDETWERGVVRLGPGDALVLYTDGITEAVNEQTEQFGEDRLLESVRANLGRPALDVRDAILGAVRGFAGDAPQSDDIALAVVVREP